MIGDPSGKSKERNLLSADVIEKNISALKIQFSKFLDFDEKNPNAAIIVNNYEWNSKLNIIEFFRDFGKLLTVNYMMSKDSVKKRISNSDLSEGMSFTEFTYQLFQAYDFYYLIIFYQYWLNSSDEDSYKYVKIFTFAKKEFIEKLIKDHNDEPHLRKLQKFIAEEITTMVHSEEDLKNVKNASSILFGKNTEQDLSLINEETFLDVFSGVPHKELTKSELTDCILVENLLEKSGFFSSKSEIRRLIDQNSISINKAKINSEFKISKILFKSSLCS